MSRHGMADGHVLGPPGRAGRTFVAGGVGRNTEAGYEIDLLDEAEAILAEEDDAALANPFAVTSRDRDLVLGREYRGGSSSRGAEQAEAPPSEMLFSSSSTEPVVARPRPPPSNVTSAYQPTMQPVAPSQPLRPVPPSRSFPGSSSSKDVERDLLDKIQRASISNDDKSLAKHLAELQRYKHKDLLQQIDEANHDHDEARLKVLLAQLSKLDASQLEKLDTTREEGTLDLAFRSLSPKARAAMEDDDEIPDMRLMDTPLMFTVPSGFEPTIDKICLKVPKGYGYASGKMMEVRCAKFKGGDKIQFSVPKLSSPKTNAGFALNDLPVERETYQLNGLVKFFSRLQVPQTRSKTHNVDAEVGKKDGPERNDSLRTRVGAA